jgi:hypothetical protein
MKYRTLLFCMAAWVALPACFGSDGSAENRDSSATASGAQITMESQSSSSRPADLDNARPEPNAITNCGFCGVMVCQGRQIGGICGQTGPGGSVLLKCLPATGNNCAGSDAPQCECVSGLN